MFLIIGALRNFNPGILSLREGKWRGQPLPALGHDPRGKVLGILGMGGIGRNLKKKAEAFGMRTIYHNRRKLSEEEADGAEYVSFDELLGTSDVISLNLPLNVSHVLTFHPICQFDTGEGQRGRRLSDWTNSISRTQLESHSSHHQQTRVPKDERWRRHS